MIVDVNVETKFLRFNEVLIKTLKLKFKNMLNIELKNKLGSKSSFFHFVFLTKMYVLKTICQTATKAAYPR